MANAGTVVLAAALALALLSPPPAAAAAGGGRKGPLTTNLKDGLGSLDKGTFGMPQAGGEVLDMMRGVAEAQSDQVEIPEDVAGLLARGDALTDILDSAGSLVNIGRTCLWNEIDGWSCVNSDLLVTLEEFIDTTNCPTQGYWQHAYIEPAKFTGAEWEWTAWECIAFGPIIGGVYGTGDIPLPEEVARAKREKDKIEKAEVPIIACVKPFFVFTPPLFEKPRIIAPEYFPKICQLFFGLGDFFGGQVIKQIGNPFEFLSGYLDLTPEEEEEELEEEEEGEDVQLEEIEEDDDDDIRDAVVARELTRPDVSPGGGLGAGPGGGLGGGRAGGPGGGGGGRASAAQGPSTDTSNPGTRPARIPPVLPSQLSPYPASAQGAEAEEAEEAGEEDLEEEAILADMAGSEAAAAQAAPEVPLVEESAALSEAVPPSAAIEELEELEEEGEVAEESAALSEAIEEEEGEVGEVAVEAGSSPATEGAPQEEDEEGSLSAPGAMFSGLEEAVRAHLAAKEAEEAEEAQEAGVAAEAEALQPVAPQ